MATKEKVFATAAYGWRDYSLKEFFEKSKEAGVSAVEVDTGWLIEAKNIVPLDSTAEEIKQAKQLAKDCGVKIVSLAGGPTVNIEDGKMIPQVEAMKRTMEVADALDVRVVRILAEHDFNESQHYIDPEDRITDALMSLLSDTCNEVAQHAEKMGMVLAIENHGGTSTAGSKLKELLDSVPSKALGVNYDATNLAWGGHDPYESLMMWKDRVVYTHWKDFSCIDGKKANRIMGEGQIDWQPIMKQFVESYDGIWAIEYEQKVYIPIEDLVAGTITSLANLKGIIAQAEGNA